MVDWQDVFRVMVALGPVAGTVTVTALFLYFAAKIADRVLALVNTLFQQIEAIAKDKGEIIRVNSLMIRDITVVSHQLEQAIAALTEAVAELYGRRTPNPGPPALPGEGPRVD